MREISTLLLAIVVVFLCCCGGGAALTPAPTSVPEVLTAPWCMGGEETVIGIVIELRQENHADRVFWLVSLYSEETLCVSETVYKQLENDGLGLYELSGMIDGAYSTAFRVTVSEKAP